MKRPRPVVKGQPGPRRKYYAIDNEDELRLNKVSKMLWELELNVRDRPAGYDAMKLEVDWVYANGTEFRTTVGYVIIEYGNSLWRIWRELEVDLVGYFIATGPVETVYSLIRDIAEISRFWAVLVGVQVVRKRFHGTMGLDGDLIQYEHVQMEEMIMRTKLRCQVMPVPNVAETSCLEYRMSMLKIVRMYEDKVEMRFRSVQHYMRDAGMQVDVVLEDQEQEGVRKLLVREIEAFKQNWFDAPVGYMNRLGSSEVTLYHNFVGITGANTGSGPKKDMSLRL